MRTAEVVIVGAGFAGAATAYRLVRRGVRNVVLIEREPVPGMHASGRNAALAFQALADAVEARLAVEGAAFIAAPPEGFADAPLLRRTGSLLVAGAEGVTALRALETPLRALGLSQAGAISVADARRAVPALRGAPFAAAFWNPSDGVVDIHALLRGYLDGVRAHGGRVVYRRMLTGVETAGGRVAGVATDDGNISTPCIVDAGGAWAGTVGALAGVGTRTLQPRRRHLFQTAVDIPIDRDWPFVWHNDLDVYFRPEGDGLLTSPCDATDHPPVEPVVDETAAQLLADKMPRAFPALAGARIVSGWACLRTFSRDGRFVIGRDPDLDGLVWVGGLGGHGMTTSPAVGRLGAAAVCGETSEALAYFSPARLA
ncbi:FAD-binding oxidoreductase [Candidatus Binatia bacterium]|nr:FAD-binding oxidoreductase [Candidatus Binatia bacterium]